MAFVHGPRVVSRRSSEQGDRKSGCPSQASYLIFRPESVAKACEAHEALTFWLLLGQAKSDRKEIQGEERSEGGDVILSKREFAELNADN
ncbi:hypothetical protein [Tannerella forsythia]|uniref:hypothetical protein n=1 Tax=Tannerella forsythia TaxID=28112 RepID=UPI0012D8DC0A|nr:hypothetical protein [Tannerella forsythia]